MKIRYIVLTDNLKYDDVAVYASALPAYRQRKIARYRFDGDKLRSLAAGLLLRREIGDSPVLFGEHEKPYAADGSVQFSLSHSGSVVAIAVDDVPVGLDAEELPAENRLKIADRFYHPNERGYVYAAVDKPLAFCRIWTRKEAYLKMTGEGISTELTAFDTTSVPLSEQLYTIDLNGCCLSVCSGKPILQSDIHISKTELNELINKQS